MKKKIKQLFLSEDDANFDLAVELNKSLGLVKYKTLAEFWPSYNGKDYEAQNRKLIKTQVLNSDFLNSTK